MEHSSRPSGAVPIGVSSARTSWLDIRPSTILGPSVFESGDACADGAELVIEALLQSPNFVYRAELGDDGAPLSGYEIASKLSFLLRNTTPDDELLDAAAAGDLDEPTRVAEIAREMLEAPGAAEAIARFHGELFGLDRYLSIAKDPNVFPEHDETLNPALARAEELFLDRLFREGLGLEELLTSTVAFVNAEISPLYGVAVAGAEFEQVDLGPERPGFFTRLGFLAYNATLRDPDSIHRGVDINRTMLCATLAPPPGIIPALPNVEPGQTNRERVNAHTGPGTCGASCHATRHQPPRLRLRELRRHGPAARHRQRQAGRHAAASTSFADGLKAFDGAPELMALIAESPQAHACYARHLSEFGLARDLDEAGPRARQRAPTRRAWARSSIKDLLLAVVRSPAFGRAPAGGAL